MPSAPRSSQFSMLMKDTSCLPVSGKEIPSLGMTVSSRVPPTIPPWALYISSGARPFPATLAALSKTIPSAEPGLEADRSITGDRWSSPPSGHGPTERVAHQIADRAVSRT